MKQTILLLAFLLSSTAYARCPQLAGSYNCPMLGVTLVLEQTDDMYSTTYTNRNTGETIVADGKLHSKSKTAKYRATCEHGNLVYNIYGQYFANDKLKEVTHEHQIWNKSGNKLSLTSTLITTYGDDTGVYNDPGIYCFEK